MPPWFAFRSPLRDGWDPHHSTPLHTSQGGLGSKLLSSNPELKPQFNSNTKFADVMGVDEV